MLMDWHNKIFDKCMYFHINKYCKKESKGRIRLSGADSIIAEISQQ